MKKKKLLLALVAALAVSQGIPVLAKPATNNPTGDEHTTIGIMEAEKDISQASFEVPLYITTAAVSNSNKLLCPTGYDIKNTSKAADAPPIGVFSLTVEKVAGSTWDIVSNTPTVDKKVQLSIGDLPLPEVNDTNRSSTVSFLTTTPDCAFYGKTKGKPTKLTEIRSGQTLSEAAGGPAVNADGYEGLGISGTVHATNRNNIKAAAQFKITYVVTTLDTTGDPIGNTYVGDDKAASGMQ